MDGKKTIWLIMKGLSYVSIGAILYTLFCMKGFWAASIATRIVT